MTTAPALFSVRGRATPWGSALVIFVIAAGTGCGISSIAPYNPDGAAHPGSGGATAGTGGNAIATGGTSVATGGAGHAASGGTGGTSTTGGSGGLASGGRGGQTGAATGGGGGQPAPATGGRGGQTGAATGGSSGAGTGGSPAGGGGSSGGSGASGAGGGPAPVCQAGDQRCSGKDVQNCAGDQWGPTNACGTHQTCAPQGRIARCVCESDSICSALASGCVSASTIASCAQDSQGCFYPSGMSMCATGTCTVAGGSASCCACTASGPACTAGGTSQTCAMGLVCGRTAPTVCTDMNWAQWPMPNGPTDVSSGASNAGSYSDNGDGTVTDKVTGLMWEKGSSGPYESWSQARAHCPTLTLGGYKDWRLPTRIELLSLVDYGVAGSATTPMINTKYFPTTRSDYHWTSTPSNSNPASEVWVVNFLQGGGGNISGGLTSGYAMCVR